MRIKILNIIVVGILFLSTGCTETKSTDALNTILKRGKIIVGVKYDTKPFGYINENQELVGFDIDLARNIAKYLLGDENKVEFKQVTPSNRILALNSNQVDMVIATMTSTNERRKVVDFSIPYYIAGQAILVPQDSKIKSITDLNGKRVIIIFGTTSENNLRLITPNATIIGFKTYTSGYEALKQKQADALFSDDSILLGFALSDNSVKLLPKRYTKEPYSIGVKKGAESQRLLTRVNAIIESMEANGELNQLNHKWIKF